MIKANAAANNHSSPQRNPILTEQTSSLVLLLACLKSVRTSASKKALLDLIRLQRRTPKAKRECYIFVLAQEIDFLPVPCSAYAIVIPHNYEMGQKANTHFKRPI